MLYPSQFIKFSQFYSLTVSSSYSSLLLEWHAPSSTLMLSTLLAFTTILLYTEGPKFQCHEASQLLRHLIYWQGCCNSNQLSLDSSLLLLRQRSASSLMLFRKYTEYELLSPLTPPWNNLSTLHTSIETIKLSLDPF